ncbi:MAG: class I SAM-dependent methyltransferase [Methanoregula sp.]
MVTKNKDKSAIDAYHEGTDYQFDTRELPLGPWTSYSLIHDPKHMCFVLSRYKFCAKMLEGKNTVMEVGSGDGFGLPIIAQAVKTVYAVDWDERLLDGNTRRLSHLKNITYIKNDLNESSPDILVDAAFSIDVLEHLEPATEDKFLKNIIKCLKPQGILITGTPNISAAQHATPRSQVQHINLKSITSLKELMEKYFENVFMFGMNDEVLHTGYGPMCHYIWSIGVGVKPKFQQKMKK